jgi:hypothetical protein
MVSMEHEILVEIFKNRPTLGPELLAEALGETIPSYDHADITGETLTEIRPAEYRADLVIKLLKANVPVLVVVIEVQLNVDPDKRFSWPVYVVGAREEHRLPVMLLVVAPDPDIAKWCAGPIETGVRGFVLRPPVLTRELVPKVKDPVEATRRPELALLSAMAFGDSDDAPEIARAATEGFSSLDPELAGFYSDIMYNAINEAARRALEVTMKGYVYTSPYAREIFQQGRDEGVKQGRDEGVKQGRDEGVKLGRDEGLKLAARSLITVLRARGIEVPEQLRQRILGEQDIHRMEQWLERAVTAQELGDVFNEPN